MEATHMTLKTVGRFSLVRDADGSEHVTGPAEYIGIMHLAKGAYAPTCRRPDTDG
mgnify:CR=1 FL=1